MCGDGDKAECSPSNFLFSNTEAWRLYSPENRHSKGAKIFYLIWKWVWAVLFTVILVMSGALPQTWYAEESQRIKYFIYLTNWGYLTFCVAQLVNAAVSTVGFVSEDEEVRWYMKLNWIMYGLTAAVAILIALLFWGLIYTSSYDLEVDTFFTHGVNGLFILVDIWITAMPIKVLHFYLPIAFGVVYIIFSVIYDQANGTNALFRPYIYQVLDWSDAPSTSAIYSVAAIFGIAVVYFILFGIYKLRVYLYKKCLPNSTLPLNGKANPYYDSVELTEN